MFACIWLAIKRWWSCMCQWRDGLFPIDHISIHLSNCTWKAVRRLTKTVCRNLWKQTLFFRSLGHVAAQCKQLGPQGKHGRLLNHGAAVALWVLCYISLSQLSSVTGEQRAQRIVVFTERSGWRLLLLDQLFPPFSWEAWHHNMWSLLLLGAVRIQA